MSERERNKSRDILSFRLLYSLPTNYTEESSFYRSVMFDVLCLLVSLLFVSSLDFLFLSLVSHMDLFFSSGVWRVFVSYTFLLFPSSYRESVYACLLFYLLTSNASPLDSSPFDDVDDDDGRIEGKTKQGLLSLHASYIDCQPILILVNNHLLFLFSQRYDNNNAGLSLGTKQEILVQKMLSL